MSNEVELAEVLEHARELAEAGEWRKLVMLVSPLHPADLAELVVELDEEHRHPLMEALPNELIGPLFEFLRADDRRALIEGVGSELLPAVLAEASDDVAADVVSELAPEEQARTLAALDDEIAALARYPDDSAGGRMSREFISLDAAMTAEAAIAELRMLRPPANQAYYLYVVDAERRLFGVVSMRDLVIAAPSTGIDTFAIRDVHAVTVETDQEEVAQVLQKYNLLAVPVVDVDGRLEGVVKGDDLMDVLEEEATEDMFRMVGLDEAERVFSPVTTSVRRRLPWMLVNLVTAFSAAGIVTLFDSTLARATVLAALMPVVAGQGGNAGAQTATIAVRSIALGQLDVGDLFRACQKEVLVGLANGLVIGVLAGLVVLALDQNVALALVLGAALTATVTAATLAGVLIPLGLKGMGVDPALAANIFVTTVTDMLGFVFFLGLAAVVIDQIA